MNNEELPLSAELASAYLDGELDETERAAASADPEVMAVVESLTLVRTLMADPGPVAASTKSAAIAAALAEFDAIRGAASPHTAAASAAAPVVSLQSRRMRVYRVLTGAAAAAIVGVVAIAALNTTRNSNDDLVTSATESPLPAATELPEVKIAADTESASAETASPAAAGAADAAAPAMPVIDTDEALRQFAADAVGADSTQIAAPTETSNAPAPNVEPTTAPSGYAAESCLSSDQVVLGPIIYQGTPALVVRVTSTGAVQAIADADCRVLVEI